MRSNFGENGRLRSHTCIAAGIIRCHDTVVEQNRVLARDYINSWVSFGIVVTNNPGTSVTIRDNKITLALPAPVEDPFGLTAGFGPANGAKARLGSWQT